MPKYAKIFFAGVCAFSILFSSTEILNAAAPTVVTLPAQNVTKTNARLTGFVSNDGGKLITSTGFDFGLTLSYGQNIVGSETYIFETDFATDPPGDITNPRGIAKDSLGNIYVTDETGNRVVIFNPDGTYKDEFGSTGSADGQFQFPHGIYIDGSDNIFVADFGNDRVQKFDTSGVFLDKTGAFVLNAPDSIAEDSSGNIFVTDTGSDSVFKFDSALDLVTSFGTHGSGDTNFDNPAGIFIDASDNLYIVDSNNSRIKKYNSALVFQQSFGSFGSGNGQFNVPLGIAQDGDGNFYVSDFTNNRIQKFDPSFNFSLIVASPGSSDGEVTSPIGLMLTSDDLVYVADYGNDRVEVLRKSFSTDLSAVVPALTCGTTYHFRAKATNADGTSFGSDQSFTTLSCDIPLMRTRGADPVSETTATLSGSHEDVGSIGMTTRGFNYGTTTSYGSTVSESGQLYQDKFGSSGGGGNPSEFVFLNNVGSDGNGNIYTTDYFEDRIQKFDHAGNYILDFGSTGSGLGQISAPSIVRGGPDGLLYVVDTGNGRIETFHEDGTSPAIFVSGLSTPTDIAFDSSGKVYVLEQGNNIIKKYSSAGVFLSDLGGGAGLTYPSSLAIGSTGYIYVSDSSNVRVVKLDSSGNLTSDVVGATGLGDGEFGGTPGYLSMDGEENIYVVDGTNNRIEKFDSSLNYLSSFGAAGSGNGEFSGPSGVATGSNGDIFVADQNNSRIQIFNERYSLAVTGLTCGTTYHYRAFGTSADGTGTSGDDTFSTSSCSLGGGATSGGGGSSTHFVCTDPNALNYSSNPKDGKVNNGICKYPAGGADSLACDTPLYLTRPIKYGAKNNPDDVKLLQKYLNTYEGYSLPVDGIYSKADFDAVVLWQEKYASEILKPWGIKKGTGYVFITSLRKIKQIHENGCEKAGVANASDACYLYDQVLKKGMKNNFVKFAQKALKANELFSASPDGNFGPITEKAVKDFQSSHNILPDGILGPATGRELEKTKCDI